MSEDNSDCVNSRHCTSSGECSVRLMKEVLDVHKEPDVYEFLIDVNLVRVSGTLMYCCITCSLIFTDMNEFVS